MRAIVQTPIRSILKEHAYPAMVSMALALTIALFLVVDRRPPFEYVSTIIRPIVASSGDTIVVERHVIWHRQCEGVAFTEIVNNADHIITIYDKGVRYPSELGDTRVERSISLPLNMRSGTATYRGVIKFASCGITSRFHSIDVPYQEATFEIK